MRSLLADSGSRAILAQDGPEDEGTSERVLSYRVVKAARKVHTCDGCPGGRIEPGSLYHAWAVLDDMDQFRIWRFCRGICRQGGVIALALALALAAGPALAKPGRCLVEIEGRRFVDGPCRVERNPDGGVHLRGDGPEPYTIRLGPEYAERAPAFWSGRYGRGEHTREPLGTVARTGPTCLANARAKFCFWTSP
jgi:hypothetical protein